jgi:hypothetical protein
LTRNVIKVFRDDIKHVFGLMDDSEAPEDDVGDVDLEVPGPDAIQDIEVEDDEEDNDDDEVPEDFDSEEGEYGDLYDDEDEDEDEEDDGALDDLGYDAL